LDLDDDWSLFYEDAAPKAIVFIERGTGVSSPPLSPSSSSSGGTLLLSSSSSSSSGLKNRMVYDSTPIETEGLPPANLFPSKDYRPSITCEQSIKQLKLKYQQEILSWCLKKTNSLIQSKSSSTTDQSMTSSSLSSSSSSSLTFDEILAIVSYTFDIGALGPREDNLYFKLNQTLRKRNGNELIIWRDYIYYLLSALDKVPKYSGHVTRGIDIELPKEKYSKNKNVVWNAFSSCSKKEEVAKSFLKNTGSLFVLDIENGCLIAEYSSIPNEDEVLILPNSEWIVTLTMSQFDPPLYQMKQNVTTQPLWMKEDQKILTMTPSSPGKSEVVEEKVVCPQHSAYFLEDYCENCKKPVCPSNS